MTDVVPLARPSITQEDRAAVMRVLASGRLSGGLSTLGFERRLASACGVAGAVAVNSGTAGLMLALQACQVGPGDEVITTPFTFVATASAIRHLGATAVLADIDPVSWNIDPARIAEAVTRRTRAVLPVHVFGRPAEMTQIRDIARTHDLMIVEDACEALGSHSGGTACGAMGDAAVFGFYPNKVVTSGEGGAVTSNDPAILEWCRRQRNHGRLPGSADGGPVPGHLGRHHAPVRLHDEEDAPESDLGEALRKALEVPPQHGADVGVEHRGGDARVEPDRWQDLRGDGEVGAG